MVLIFVANALEDSIRLIVILAFGGGLAKVFKNGMRLEKQL